MKFKSTVHFPPRLQTKKRRHGFALIATLTLMMLLTMLAVGILAMASTQNRIAMQTVLQSEARQQALLGLDAAIGELQMELGPDRRITASSSIISENEGLVTQHLLGVWDSWDAPIYGKSSSGKCSKISETYEKGRGKMFRRWLISSADTRTVKDFNGATELGKRKPGTRICLVGEGTLGRRFRSTHHIYADMLSMPASGENTGCFAWWVGGENQKSKISVQDPESVKSADEILHRTWDTPAPLFLESEYMDFFSEGVSEPEKLLTMASLPLLNTASQDAGMPYFFDVTTSSYSLIVNVRDGGLKHDLNLLLNKKSLKGTDFEVRSDQDCPIADNNEIPTGTEKSMPIGSWQNLHAYYNCWPDGSGKDDEFGTRLVGNLGSAYTRMAGELLKKGDTETVYDSRANLDDRLGYARVPVMLAFMNNFGLVTEKNSEGNEKTEATYNLSMCFSPMVLWWNPYNVPMKIRSTSLWTQSVPYKSMWLQTYSKTGNQPYKWGTYAMSQSTGLYGFGLDYGNYFMRDIANESSDIEFAPGEIIFFSPGVARLKEEYSKPYSNPWVVGYNPTSVAGYQARFYSGKKQSEVDSATWRVGIRLGVYTDSTGYSAGSYQTDGYWFAPDHTECFTLLNGYGGMGSADGGVGSSGKYGQSPQRFLLGWYDPYDSQLDTTICDSSQTIWSTEGQDDPSAPYFIASVGIVAKSANLNLDHTVYPNEDFRAKIWQHSSPVLWGAMIVQPERQQCQYHPYQFASLDVGSGAASSPMDNIGRNGMLGITSDGEQVSFASVAELPLHPPFSLAGFAGMRLVPGWYKSGGNTPGITTLRRMQYQSGVPGVGIGNSFADPCLPAGDVYCFYSGNKIPTSSDGNNRVFGDFYDHGLLINDALWDRWFCSSLSDMPKKNGKIEAKETLQKFLAGTDPLPVSRYKRTKTPYKDSDIIARILDSEEGWKNIAQYLIIDGGFNINSTSEEAWTSVLQGLANRKLVAAASDGKLSEVEPNKNKGSVLFSRFMVSTTEKSLDSLGGYSALQGDSSLRKDAARELAAWGEVRCLDSSMIRELARQIVKQVRERGPFLNMSDFINRRLDSSGSDSALTGALQAAIDATSINDIFNDERVTAQKQGDLYKFSKAAEGSLYTAAPGYLIQSDVLASLGNILTLRDDTFTVRAYGCVRSKSKAILAQAWCEAIVQRTVDYVDPSNSPTDRDSKAASGGRNTNRLTELNKVMGRRFRIVSFKWLDAWDI